MKDDNPRTVWLAAALLVAGFSVLSATSLMVAAASSLKSQRVWRIGRFDQSSSEFHLGKAPTPAPVFVVGTSSPRQDWYAFQPGSADAPAGDRPHAVTVRFDLKEKPKGLYTLKVGMLVRTHHLSVLQLSLNGHPGWVYQRPEWHDAPGNKYYNDLATVELPTRDLHVGTNNLVLTALDTTGQSVPDRSSGIWYDALELEQNPSRKFNSGAISAAVHPTIFYKRLHGQLVELVDVFTTQNSTARNGSVTLWVNRLKVIKPLSAGRDFGQQQTEFAVPAFAAGTPARLVVRLGRHTRQFRVTLEPAKKWTVYVVPHEHLDVGYTDYQPKVAEIHSRVFDEALEMMRENPQFRYSPDGFWEVQQFWAGRSAEDHARLIKAIQQRRFFVPAQYANLLTGFPTVETLIRSLYAAYRFDQRYHEPFDYANDTDVPSYTWSYASILAAAGIKYFVGGCDQTRGPILNDSHLQERSPFWWEGPDGKKVLMWYSDSYGQVGRYFGLPPLMKTGEATLPIFLQVYAGPEYKPDSILLFGAQWENSDLYPQQATFVGAWNRTYAYPHLIYSGVAHALAAIARQDRNTIPVYRGDGGPYWEDGIASDAYYAAMNRETEQRALSAEKISTISSLVNPLTRPNRRVVQQMWRNLILFDEHTWGAAGSIRAPQSEESVRQLAVKDAFATRARQEAQYVVDRGMAAVADKIPDPGGTWVVFNSLNWPRSALVEADLAKGFEIVDLATHQTVPYQVLAVSGNEQRVRFLAQNVPSVGYRCYAIQRMLSAPTNLPGVSGNIMENAYYRVVLDPQSGAVKSIFDKQLAKELVNAASPYRFDQYLYVTGGDTPPRNSLLYSDRNLPPAALTVHAAANGRLLSITRAPFGLVARLESSALNTPRIDSEIILFNDEKKIEFIDRVRKRPVYAKEGVYFAFPLAMDHPQFRYELQNGYVNPARDQLPGAGKEWFSVQHWVEAQQGNASVALVPVDASLVSLGDIVRGTWPLEFGRRKGTIFSYVMNNYWFTNYRAAQGGKFTFRYVLTSDREFQPAMLSRLGWSEMTPFEVDDIIPNDKAINTPEPLNAAEDSFVSVNSPDVVLTAWKRPMNGEGSIMRFVEVAGRQGNVRVRLPLMDVEQAWQCNAMEQNQLPLSVSVHGFGFAVRPFEIVTVRIAGKSVLKPTSR